MNTWLVRSCAALLCAASLYLSNLPALAQGAPQSLTGLVIDQRSALPIAGANVVVSRENATVASSETDSNGRYHVDGVAPGIYAITVSARGYEPSTNTGIAIIAGMLTSLDAALSLATTSGRTGTTVIGRVSTSGSNILSAATTISRNINVENVTQTGQIRISDQLAALPATNFSTSSSAGDDASLNLRGFGSDETASLFDGHPVGPLGVGSGGFNFSLGPAYGLTSIDVTYGSGAQGLFGSDTIGGAVNYVTINPTSTPHFSFQQQIGGAGILGTGLTATGMLGKLGYAFAGGRLGEFGDFAPGQITQSARPDNVDSGAASPNGACAGSSNDVSACNLAVNTYAVSQKTQQSIGLGKLTYALSPATNVRFTAYTAVQWSDSTGNGDNDYLPYSVRLGQVQSGTPDCTTSGGVAGYTVTTDPIGGTTACYTAQQFAGATYGPDGGGAGRQRSTSMRDYNLLVTTNAGKHQLTASSFINNYWFWKDNSLASGLDASGNRIGSTYANYYNTAGLLLSDALSLGPNDLSFGFTNWHQRQNGEAVGTHPKVGDAYFGEYSYFVRDAFHLNDKLSFFLNSWVKHSSVSDRTTFDPRATVQFRPSSHDVVQFTYGRSDGAPAPKLKATGPAIALDPGPSLTNVNCGGYNDVASAGDPNLKSESADDLEFGYGHRFSGDSNVQVNAYVTAVKDQIFGASQPLLQYGINNVAFQGNVLQTYLQRLQSQCPGQNITLATLPQYLSVSTSYNAASALARGIELSGRQRFAKIAYIDYAYYIASSMKTGINDNILLNNPTVVNGAQLSGIPLHQATLSLDVAPGPWEFRIDNYYVGSNNTLNRPAYWHSNAFLSRSFGKDTLLTLGGTNIFNSAVQTYGLIGLGTAPITNSISQVSPTPSEEFGLSPAQLTLTFQKKI
jgi:outer membrane cobalamin receptor